MGKFFLIIGLVAFTSSCSKEQKRSAFNPEFYHNALNLMDDRKTSETKPPKKPVFSTTGSAEFPRKEQFLPDEEVTFNMKDSASWLELEIWKRNPKRISIKKINLLFCDSVPTGLTIFPNATELYVYKSKNLKGISVLKSIHTLHLRYFTGKLPAELDKLDALKTLRLNNTRIDSFASNVCKRRIEHLFAHHSKIGITFKELNEWHQLKTLVIKGSQNKNFSSLSDIDMLSFPDMTTLKIVGYYHNFKGIPVHLEQNRPANCLIMHKGMTAKEKIKVRSLKAGLYSR